MADWDEDSHPRDDHGRFGSGGGGKPSKGLATWVAHKAGRLAAPLANKAIREGGFTYRPGASKDDRSPKSGIMVSRAPTEGHGHVVEVAKIAERLTNEVLALPADKRPSESQIREKIDRETRTAVKAWLVKALPSIERLGPDHYLGGYAEKDTAGNTVALHFDVSQRFDTRDRERAIQTGRDRNQISVWHIEKGEEIPTGGSGR